MYSKVCCNFKDNGITWNQRLWRFYLCVCYIRVIPASSRGIVQTAQRCSMENKGLPHSPPKSYSLEVVVKPSSFLLLPQPLLFVVILMITTMIFNKVKAFGQVVDHLIAKSVSTGNYKWHVQTTDARPRSCLLLEAKLPIWSHVACHMVSCVDHNWNALSMISSLPFFKAKWRVKATYKATLCRLSAFHFLPVFEYCLLLPIATPVFVVTCLSQTVNKAFSMYSTDFSDKTPLISHIF